jgi:hypothetical protein
MTHKRTRVGQHRTARRQAKPEEHDRSLSRGALAVTRRAPVVGALPLLRDHPKDPQV